MAPKNPLCFGSHVYWVRKHAEHGSTCNRSEIRTVCPCDWCGRGFENRLRNKNESSQLQKNINRGGWFELGVSHDARRAGTDGDAAWQEDCIEEDEQQQQLIHTAGSARFASGHRWHVGVNLAPCGSAERTAQPQCWASGQLPDPPADRSPRRAEPITHERAVHSRSRRTNARQHPTHERAVNPRPGWAEAGWRSSD